MVEEPSTSSSSLSYKADRDGIAEVSHPSEQMPSAWHSQRCANASSLHNLRRIAFLARLCPVGVTSVVYG